MSFKACTKSHTSFTLDTDSITKLNRLRFETYISKSRILDLLIKYTSEEEVKKLAEKDKTNIFPVFTPQPGPSIIEKIKRKIHN